MQLALAPLANISHAGLRMLIHRYEDPDEYFTEMIHAPSLLAGGQFERWYLRTNPAPEKIVWQLTSHKAEAFVQAVPLVLKQGGFGIDINMGCCAPPIIRSGAGFAWMLKPLEETAAMVRSVAAAVNRYAATEGKEKRYRLSVKLRIGVKEDYAFLLQFCKMLEAEGVTLLTIHPRLQKQSYSRPALHHYTARLAQDMAIPVYGNGDIDSAEKLYSTAEKYPCAGWMIGRAAVQKPWIFKEMKKKADNSDPIDVEEAAALFLQYVRTEQPPPFHLTRAQRFFQFFCTNFSFAHYCKTQLLRAASLEEMEQRLHAYFRQVPADRTVLPKTEPHIASKERR